MNRTHVAAGVFALILGAASIASAADDAPKTSFADRVDLAPLGVLAVHHDGRFKSFDSHASAMMHDVTGPHRIDGRSPSFLYIDLMLRPDAYETADVLYVKNKLVRERIADTIRAAVLSRVEEADKAQVQAIMDERLASFEKTGLASPMMMVDPAVQKELDALSRDLITTGKAVNQVHLAMQSSDPRRLRENLRLIPPASGNDKESWLTMDEVVAAAAEQHDLGIDAATLGELTAGWRGFEEAWGNQDAQATNETLAKFTAAVARHAAAVDARRAADHLSPLYPDAARLSWERRYFDAHNFTWVWIIYGLAVVPLLLSVVYRWSAARWIGLGLFVVAFGFHTFALGLRWYISGRWPNSNMFEAVTTSAWFGGCLAILMEALIRRTAMRNLFALGSAVGSMVAFMAAHFLPVELNPNIANKMPVLHDVWLYIHTNVIIFSYCMIFMAAVPAAMCLAYRAAGTFAGFGGAGDYARVGGAGSLIVTAPGGGETFIQRARSNFGQVLDGTTMVLMELGFILLFTGLVMGAIWADHSWGRPWGWDPKEVFALNTFLILLLLVHVRLKVKDKGLWTAILALAGAGVMLFNWIIINFTISGLHSYA